MSNDTLDALGDAVRAVGRSLATTAPTALPCIYLAHRAFVVRDHLSFATLAVVLWCAAAWHHAVAKAKEECAEARALVDARERLLNEVSR